MKTCIDCGKTKDIRMFNRHPSGSRPECKQCERNRRIARDKANPIESRANKMAQGILARVKHKSEYIKNRSYKERKVKSEIGETVMEIREVLLKHFEREIKELIDDGKTPSVNRINPLGKYSIDNIEIIDSKKNVRETGVRIICEDKMTGTTITFNSITEAAKHYGVKRETIYTALNRPEASKQPFTANYL